jgi:hypothetical protein
METIMIKHITSNNTTPPAPAPATRDPKAPWTGASSFYDLFTSYNAAPTKAASPAASKSEVATPALSTPVVSKPVVSSPAVSSAVVTKPVVSAPVVNKPIESTPAAAKPVIKAVITSAPAPAAVTAQPLDGNLYEQNATVMNPLGATTALNPMEMATDATAQAMAAKLGGTVVTDQFTGGYSTSAPTREISVPGSNNKINAGVAASLFAAYGDAPGSQAWQIINRDLGIAS